MYRTLQTGSILPFVFSHLIYDRLLCALVNVKAAVVPRSRLRRPINAECVERAGKSWERQDPLKPFPLCTTTRAIVRKIASKG